MMMTRSLSAHNLQTKNVSTDFDSTIQGERKMMKSIRNRYWIISLFLGLIFLVVLLGTAPSNANAENIGGIDLGDLTDYVLFYADASDKANWQGATKGFVGNVAVDGIQADESTSAAFPLPELYSQTIHHSVRGRILLTKMHPLMLARHRRLQALEIQP